MFAKLLKHEWKDNYKLLSILSACILGAGILAAVLLRSLIGIFQQPDASEAQLLFQIPLYLALVFVYIAIAAYSVATPYILLFRFYKSRFTDRGYLMFTLPVKTHYHFLAPALNMLIWQVIALVVSAVSIGVAVLFGVNWAELIGPEVFYGMDEAFSAMIAESGPHIFLFMALSVLSWIITLVSGVVTPMACVVIGTTIAKKHKVLASIGMIYGVNMVSGIITSIFSMIPQFMMFADNVNFDLILYLTPVLNCIVPLATGIVGYILSVKLMKNKLNLP